MGFLDIILGAFLVFGLIRGLKNGLIIEFASLISFFVGIYIAIKFSYLLGESKTAKVTAFVIVLIIVILGIRLIAKMLSKIASTLFLGWLNKLGGAIFAILRTALILGVVLNLIIKINVNNVLISKKTQETSMFVDPILKISEFMMPVLTDWFFNLKKNI
ncbi:MAG: CvpA family protein [Flavobacterium sp.]|nr:CvpA family protein [Flavobacterium sp.]